MPRREIGSTTQEKLGNYAGSRDRSMYAAADELAGREHLDARFTERPGALQALDGRGTQELRGRGPDRALRSMVMDIDYENWIRQKRQLRQGR